MADRPPVNAIVGSHRTIYESLFQQADTKKTGAVVAIDAVGFLKSSGLAQDVLASIWDRADKGAKGYLDYHDFCVALKLIAVAQSPLGLEPSLENLMADVMPPNMGEASRIAEAASVGVAGTWEVSPSEQAKYSQVFDSLGPSNGVLPGALCRQVFMKSRLPVDVLGKIWELSDIDRDGALDREEFVLAMHLVYKVSMEKQPLPSVLSASLIPPSKVNVVLASAVPPSSSQQDLAALQAPILMPAAMAPAPVAAAVPWVVTPAEKAQYDVLFQNADVNKVGYLTGAEARDIFMKSGLPPAILAHIWQLSDSTGSGKLNPEQFALAMYLTNARLRGIDLPVQLTPEMVPPSLRQPVAAAPVLGVASAAASEFPESKELQELNAEVDVIRKERQAVESEIEQQQSEVNRRHADLSQVQREVDQLTNLLQQLEQQRVEAQKKLDDLDDQRNRCQRAIDEVKERTQQERTECSQMQGDITNFQSQSQEKQGELSGLRQSVEGVRAQERQLETSAAQQRQAAESEKSQTAEIERQCDELQTRLGNLERLSSLLKDAAASYDLLLGGDSSVREPDFDPDVSLSQLLSVVMRPPPAPSGLHYSSDPFASSTPAAAATTPSSRVPPQRPPAPGSSANISSPQSPPTSTATGGDDFITDLFWGNAVAADPHLRSVSAPPSNVSFEQIAAMDPSGGRASASALKQAPPPARPPPPKKAMTPVPSSVGHYSSQQTIQHSSANKAFASADPFAPTANAFPSSAKNDPFASSGHPDPFKSAGPDPFADDGSSGFGAAFPSSSAGGGAVGFDDDDAWAVRK